MLRAWRRGEIELVVSPKLLEELARVLGYPKLRRRIPAADATEVLALLKAEATSCPDPAGRVPIESEDPDDDYLIKLAAAERAVLVSGDKHLLALADRLPIYRPRELLDLISP